MRSAHGEYDSRKTWRRKIYIYNSMTIFTSIRGSHWVSAFVDVVSGQYIHYDPLRYEEKEGLMLCETE